MGGHWALHSAESREQGSNGDSSGETGNSYSINEDRHGIFRHQNPTCFIQFEGWRWQIYENCTLTDSNAITFIVFGINVSSGGNSKSPRIAYGENRQYLQREPWRGGAVFSNELTSRLHKYSDHLLWSTLQFLSAYPATTFHYFDTIRFGCWYADNDIEFPYTYTCYL